ncbi:MAG: ATPase, partial [Clostridia bacterium]|nr:ATPase [Clostridia bacterium]
MSRDLIVIPSEQNQKIIIATDCSGACGPKKLDVVVVPTVLTSYYTARVAFMEIMSVRATPIAYTVSNFVKGGYDDIHDGVAKLTGELKLPNLANITSSETNFEMLQSAVGISVVGTMMGEIDDNAEGLFLAVVGLPLVGDEMLQNLDSVLQMDTFTGLLSDTKVQKLLT